MTSTDPSSPSPGLRFLLDTADVAAWKEWLPLGFFFGVTTNPILLKAAGIPCDLAAIGPLVGQALDAGAGEVQVQTWGRTRDLYVAHGRAVAALSPKVVVKAPTTVEGTAAAATLRSEGVRVTMTAVYSAGQALIASALGAEYAAPYFGRMNDSGRDGFKEIATMAQAMRAHGAATRILVASLRAPSDIVRLAAEGLDTFTFGPKLAAGFFADDQTRQAVEAFEDAAEGK